MNPLDLSKLINFSDTTPITDVIDLLQRLDKAYDIMVSDAEAKSKRYADALTGIVTAAKTLEDQIIALDSAEKDQADAIAKSAQQADKLAKENEAYTNSLKQVEKEVLALTAAQGTLESAKKKLEAANTAEAGSVADLKKQLNDAVKSYEQLGPSVDAAVKKESLDRVRTLSNNYKDATTALAQAKKGADFAAGSYNELSNRVAVARKALKDMEGGINNQSDEFKELQKFVSDGTETLKQWDSAMGVNTRNVGNYEGALKDLKIQLKQARDEMAGIASTLGIDSEEYQKAALRAGDLKDQIGDMNEDLNAVSGEPIERLSGSFGLLTQKLKTLDFKGASVQINQFTKASKELTFKQAIQGTGGFTKSIISMGRALLTNPIFLIAALVVGLVVAIVKLKDHVGFLKIAFDAVGKAIDIVIQAGKDFLDFIGLTNFALEDQTTRIVANSKKQIEAFNQNYDRRIELANAEGKAVLELEKAKLRAIQYSAAAALRALEKKSKLAIGLTDEEKESYKELTETYQNAYQQLLIINAKYITDVRKQEEAGLVELNRIRLQAAIDNQERIAANDSKSFDQRFDATVKAERLRNALLAYERDQDFKAAGESITKRIAIQAAYNQKVLASTRKRLEDETSLLNAYEKKVNDSYKRMADAQRALDTERLNDTIRLSNAILANEDTTLAERLDAIAEGTHAQELLLKQSQEKELADAREAAIARVKITDDQYKAIFANTKLSADERLQLLRKAQEEQLDVDQVYSTDVIRISEDTSNKLDQINKDSVAKIRENVFTVMERDALNFQNAADTAANDALRAINEAFTSGAIKSVRDYETLKNQIQANAERDSINNQLKYLRERARLLEAGGKERIAIEKQISDLELKLSEESAARQAQIDQDLHEQLKASANGALQSALQFIQDRNDAEDADRQYRLQQLDAQEQKTLQIVGDSKAAQALVEQNFAAKKKKIDDEQRAADRRRAVFEKALAITEIAINTAKGVSQALGAYPPPASFIFAALVAALGAVQIATVASKPIPAFETGTMSSPEGWAIVNEGGRELIVDGRTGEKRIINSDGPTMTYLTKGSKVFTADQTDAMASADFGRNAGDMAGLLVDRSDNMRQVEKAIHANTKAVTAAIANQEFMSWDEKGYRQFTRNANSKVEKLNKRYSIGS